MKRTTKLFHTPHLSIDVTLVFKTSMPLPRLVLFICRTSGHPTRIGLMARAHDQTIGKETVATPKRVDIRGDIIWLKLDFGDQMAQNPGSVSLLRDPEVSAVVEPSTDLIAQLLKSPLDDVVPEFLL